MGNIGSVKQFCFIDNQGRKLDLPLLEVHEALKSACDFASGECPTKKANHHPYVVCGFYSRRPHVHRLPCSLPETKGSIDRKPPIDVLMPQMEVTVRPF